MAKRTITAAGSIARIAHLSSPTTLFTGIVVLYTAVESGVMDPAHR